MNGLRDWLEKAKSLPVRECGLKSYMVEDVEAVCQSLPVRECGLKYAGRVGRVKGVAVTPCAGVWIEILPLSFSPLRTIVTPCAGVWIEISIRNLTEVSVLSLPVRECGLKWE